MEGHVGFSEAARRLGCSRQNVYQQALKGRIPCVRDENGNPCIPEEWIAERAKNKQEDE